MSDPSLPAPPSFPPPSVPPPRRRGRPRWLIPVLAMTVAVGLALAGSLLVLPALLDKVLFPAADRPVAANAGPTPSALASAPEPAGGATPASAGGAEPSATPAAPPAGVPRFSSASAGFSAQFPTAAKKMPVAASPGLVPGTEAFAGGDGIQNYTVTSVPLNCQLADAQVQSALEEATSTGIDAGAKSLNGTSKVLSTTGRDVDGHPGIQSDFTMTVGSRTMKGRYVSAVAGTHYYAVAIVALEPELPAWDAFINSVKFLAPTESLPACAP